MMDVAHVHHGEVWCGSVSSTEHASMMISGEHASTVISHPRCSAVNMRPFTVALTD